MSEFMMVRKKLIADSLDRIEMRTRKNGIVPPYSSKGSAREMEICMQQMGCLRDGTLYGRHCSQRKSSVLLTKEEHT